nr:PREDICTED: E3 ubiquitin-protein ligase synoviolin-like [Apteryx mantelli mantelli]
MAFMTIMIKVHTFPLFAIRPMYLAMRQFKKAVTDAIMSRRAIRNMNTLYPDATPEELQAMDNVCIICREEMVTGAKRLPCNHIFHTSSPRNPAAFSSGDVPLLAAGGSLPSGPRHAAAQQRRKRRSRLEHGFGQRCEARRCCCNGIRSHSGGSSAWASLPAALDGDAVAAAVR